MKHWAYYFASLALHICKIGQMIQSLEDIMKIHEITYINHLVESMTDINIDYSVNNNIP